MGWLLRVRTGFLLMAATGLACQNTSDEPAQTVEESAARDSTTSFASAGAEIYFSARSGSGSPIQVTGSFASADGQATRACADCHGVDGRGASVPTDSGTLKTPAITYRALTTPAPHRRGMAYDEMTLAMVLRTGVRMDGYVLDSAMPRWRIAASDFQHLVEFLQSLDSVPRPIAR